MNCYSVRYPFGIVCQNKFSILNDVARTMIFTPVMEIILNQNPGLGPIIEFESSDLK